MPDTLNKQTLVNLLIDSPLREPIKINLIDIVNNTNDVDLPKTYSTIVKELEIFQKATERRMKLADETIAKLGGSVQSDSVPPVTPPPLDLPPLPAVAPSDVVVLPPAPPMPTAPDTTGLTVPPLDLPPLPQVPPTTPTTSAQPGSSLPPLEPPKTADADEAALAEIQKELDALKSSATADASIPPVPAAPAAPVQSQ